MEKPELAAAAIVDSGYYGLLNDILPKSSHRIVLFVNFFPGKIILRSENFIKVSHQKLTSQMLDCLLALSKGECSKELLVKKLWGYDYHSLRHDPLIYRMMGRLRAAIPLGQEFILSSETGYRLIHDLHFLFPEDPRPATKKEEPKINEPLAAHQSLNFRQLQILKTLKKKDFLGAKDVREMFGISPITASRDLSELFSLGLVLKAGDARATKYFLKD